MTVYLLRHGIAEDTPPGKRDADRELTAEGRRRLKDVLSRASKAGVRPKTILTSPYTRAMQTAKLAAKELEAPEPIETEALVPHGNPREVWSALSDYRGSGDVLLAGHEPLLSATVSHFLGAPALQVEMKKGALVAIEFASLRGEPKGVLNWMLTPGTCS